MTRARVDSRYLYQERHKKQYALTKTKLAVGFLISLCGSVFGGTYLERYGPVILDQAGSAIHSVFSDDQDHTETQSENSAEITSGTAKAPVSPELNDLEGRVRSLREKDQAQRASDASSSPDSNSDTAEQ